MNMTNGATSLSILLTALVTSSLLATEHKPGEQAVVVRPVEMMVVTGSPTSITPGQVVTVREAAEGRLKVVAGRVGWIDAAAVLPVDEADEYFAKLVEKNPADAAAMLARGKLRFERAGLDSDKNDAAMADLDRSLKLRPSSEALTLRGFAWKRKGDKDKALADFDAAIKLDPHNALAWRVRGATWAAKADYGQALANYTESIRVDPENPDSRHHRVVLQSACMDGQYRNGQRAIDDATKACEVSEWQSPLYLTGLAMANAEAGHFEDAVRWQTKALELSPKAVQTYQTNLDLFKQHKPFRMTWR